MGLIRKGLKLKVFWEHPEAIGDYMTQWRMEVEAWGNIGASILKAGPNIDSHLENQMIDHFFHGEGADFILSPDQTSRYLESPAPRFDPEFDYGIGRENPSGDNDRIDRYDFDPQDWGERTYKAEVATRMAEVVGKIFGGEGYDVYLHKSCN